MYKFIKNKKKIKKINFNSENWLCDKVNFLLWTKPILILIISRL